jgi:hypothetical protein
MGTAEVVMLIGGVPSGYKRFVRGIDRRPSRR